MNPLRNSAGYPGRRNHQHQQDDAGIAFENVRVELARVKAEISRMTRWLRAKKLANKQKKKELRRTKRFNKRMDELVEGFLATAEVENNICDSEAANLRTGEAINEAILIQAMNDLNLNLDGPNYIIGAVDQIQRPCFSSSGRDADGNAENESGEGSNNEGFGGGEGHD